MARGPGQSAREAQRRNASGAMGLLSEYAGEVLRGDMLRRGLDRYYRGIGSALSGDQAAFSGLLGDAFPGGGGLLGALKVLDVPYSAATYPARHPNAQFPTFEVMVNPTESDLYRLLARERKIQGPGFDETIRLLPDEQSGLMYAWHAANALHPDMADYLKIPRLQSIGPTWVPD